MRYNISLSTIIVIQLTHVLGKLAKSIVQIDLRLQKGLKLVIKSPLRILSLLFRVEDHHNSTCPLAIVLLMDDF